MSEDNLDKILRYRGMESEPQYSRILGVRFLLADLNHVVALILSWQDKNAKPRRISFLDPLKLMQIRWSRKRAQFLNRNQQIFLMEGRGLLMAARFLAGKKKGKKLSETITMTRFLHLRIQRSRLFMQLMDIANAKGYSVYFLSNMSQKNLISMQKKLLKFFPWLRIVGNHRRKDTVEREMLVKQALHKASPDLILFGDSFWSQEKWTHDNWQYISHGVAINLEQCLKVLYGPYARFRIIRRIQDSGWAWLWRIILQPWRLDYWFYLCTFFACLLRERLR